MGHVHAAERVDRAICRVGGGHGWYAADWLWRIRGWMDRLVGGPGLRRGRRDPEQVAYGEALDFWRVIDVQADRRLALRAEMRMPFSSVMLSCSATFAGTLTMTEPSGSMGV